MAETHLLMKITIIPGTSSIIKGMTGNASHQGNGRLFQKARNPKISFMYLIEPNVHLGNGSQRLQGGTYQWKGTCLKLDLLKMFLSTGLYQVAGSPLGTMSIDSTTEVYESDGD